MKEVLYQMPVWAKILLSLFVAVVSFAVFVTLGVGLAYVFFPADIITSEALSNVERTDNTAILKYAQAVQSVGLFVVSPLAIAWLFSPKPQQFLFTNKSGKLLSYLFALLLILSLQPVISYLAVYNAQISLPDFLAQQEKLAELLTLKFLNTQSPLGLIANLIALALIPSVGEELVFRGLIQGGLSRYLNAHVAILITAIIFSAIHMQFSGFFPRMLMGMVLGYLFWWSQSVWLPIFAHFVNNATAIVSYYFGGGKIDSFSQQLESASPSATVFVWFVLLTAMFMQLIYRQGNTTNHR